MFSGGNNADFWIYDQVAEFNLISSNHRLTCNSQEVSKNESYLSIFF